MSATNPNLDNLIDPMLLDDDYEYDPDRLWNCLDSPIYRVVDEEGVNVAEAALRRIAPRHWIYQDNIEGCLILDDEEVDHLLLVPEDKHQPFGWDAAGNVVAL